MPSETHKHTMPIPRTARELGIMQGFPPPPEKRPTLENWDLAPFNRWSFQNVRSLIPTVDVRRGDGAPAPLPVAHQAISNLVFRTHAGDVSTVGDWLRRSYTDGLLLMHRGKILAEIYDNGMERHTPHLSQSVSKSIMSALVGVLAADGLFDLDAPLIEIIPELAGSGYADATLAQVLDMRSGVRFDETYGAASSDMTRIDIASGWRPPTGGQPASTIRDVILTLPKERPHGGPFLYRSIESDVLAWAMERAAGQTLADLVSTRIWQPIGAERDAYFTVDAAGTALADGGFNATLRDYARFGLMILNQGRTGDVQVVPNAWIEQSRSGDARAFGPPYTTVSPKGAYRNQWWIHDVTRGDIMARGIFGQMIFIDPQSDFLMVKLSSWPQYLIDAANIDAISAAMMLREALS